MGVGEVLKATHLSITQECSGVSGEQKLLYGDRQSHHENGKKVETI